MAYQSKLIGDLKPTTKEAQEVARESDSQLSDLMTDPDYLRQSSALINEALQKGFDVLQMPNGDIVTTGTKTVVNTYSWDNDKAKLLKSKTSEKKARAKAKIEEMLDDDL